MSFSEQISPLIGRWVLAWFFLSEVWSRAGEWKANVALMEFQGLPVAPLLLALAFIVMILGGLSLLLGYQTRHGALLLFAFTVIVTLVMHAFWKIHAGSDRAADYDIFARNIAIAGGLLVLVGLGSGPFALDNKTAQKKR
jgi:putative oxidoreductase